MQYFIGDSSLALSHAQNNKPLSSTDKTDEDGSDSLGIDLVCDETGPQDEVGYQGQLIVDATACPEDIAYPADFNLLNDAREKTQEMIDLIYNPVLHQKRPSKCSNISRTD